jgi:hypothetical protein
MQMGNWDRHHLDAMTEIDGIFERDDGQQQQCIMSYIRWRRGPFLNEVLKWCTVTESVAPRLF